MENEQYDVVEVAVYEKYSKKIEVEIVYFFIEYLKYKGYNFLVAPYEADSQLYYMYQ